MLKYFSAFALAATLGLAGQTAYAQATAQCDRTVKADVVVLDQPLMFNRFGAQNVNGMIYALRSDVVEKSSGLPESQGGFLSPGNVELRKDKRPRPIVLRVRQGDCLEVTLTNYLSFTPNPNNAVPATMTINDQVSERMVGFSPIGMNAVNSVDDTSSYVGKNSNSLVAPGGTRTYTLYAADEGSHLITSHAAAFGGEGTGGNLSNGLFGAVTVQPENSEFYRSQVTEEDLRLATIGNDFHGSPDD